MPKAVSVFICQQCGFKAASYLGKCPQCGTWNSMVEEIESRQSTANSRQIKQKSEIVNLKDVIQSDFKRVSTGLGEFDRVLGGGIVAGSVVLIAGDPGIGKSTVLLQVALNVNSNKAIKQLSQAKETLLLDSSIARTSVLYVAGEESAQQIKIRADRIKPKADLAILQETDVDIIIGVIEQLKPSLVIIDSIQTMETEDLTSPPGSVGQVKETAHRLHRLAKSTHIPIFIVGHVTKEGTVAGPKTLEHRVDVILSLEGDSSTNFRILRGNKNRFGTTDEVGIFEMEETGMIEVSNPSKLFLETRLNAPGSTVVPIITGLRPILVEIQALVTKTNLPIPRRTGSGIDNNRLQLLVAVLQKRLGLHLFDQDIFVNVTGGLKVYEPAADLAIAMAIISSFKDQVLPANTAYVGEVGLLGEIRAVRGVDKRINEAKKLGFTNIISSDRAKSLSAVWKLCG